MFCIVMFWSSYIRVRIPFECVNALYYILTDMW